MKKILHFLNNIINSSLILFKYYTVLPFFCLMMLGCLLHDPLFALILPAYEYTPAAATAIYVLMLSFISFVICSKIVLFDEMLGVDVSLDYKTNLFKLKSTDGLLPTYCDHMFRINKIRSWTKDKIYVEGTDGICYTYTSEEFNEKFINVVDFDDVALDIENEVKQVHKFAFNIHYTTLINCYNKKTTLTINVESAGGNTYKRKKVKLIKTNGLTYMAKDKRGKVYDLKYCDYIAVNNGTVLLNKGNK